MNTDATPIATPEVPRPPRRPSVCVIGAGSSGLPAIKALAERGIPVRAFERSDRVGGNWAFRNPNGLSAVYRSLHTNSSRVRSQYADHPMPADFPHFPHHSQMAAYFESYAARFALKERIRFDATVTDARRGPRGWEVRLAEGETHGFDVLLVANGHHWKPRWPDPPLPGTFDGDILHAHDYTDPDEPVALRGRRVVVVGLGNSAVDIACELAGAGAAAGVTLSVRRGAWIMPKFIAGLPIDRLGVSHPRLPWRLQSVLARIALAAAGRGAPWKLGLPRPDHPPLAAHPTLSADLPGHLRRGAIVAKPPIERFEGSMVRFADGSSTGADAVIFCTGYSVCFPFFAPDLVTVPDNDLPLWHRIARPGERDLFFVGLLQPLGAIMPLAEAQAKLIAAALDGEYLFPSPEAMAAETRRQDAARAARFVASPRHAMEVDYDGYLHDLRRELAAGRARRQARA
jgi:dimethylaniline monooxygenase (N-oxide forming)